MSAEQEGPGSEFGVTFALTAKERELFARLNTQRQWAAVGMTRSWVTYLMTIPIGLAGALLLMAGGLDGRRLGAPAATLIGIAYILGFWAFSYLAKWSSRHAFVLDRQLLPTLQQEGRVIVGLAGIEIVGVLARASYSWPAVTEVTRHGGLIVFWIGLGRGIAVAERAVANPEALLDFARGRMARPAG